MADEKNTAWCLPETVVAEYERGIQYKNNIGAKGMYEQNRLNERFYSGDQWHGASVGTNRPLVRYNVIKRIGEYKQSVIGASPVTVHFSAEGVPNTVDLQEAVKKLRDEATKRPVNALADVMGGIESDDGIPTGEEVNLVMSALSDYFRVESERLQFDDKKQRVLNDAYCSGTGVLYTYWDETVKTGLYADERRKTPITGDIACEVLNIENVYFGDPTDDDVQKQPFIIVSQRFTVDEVLREMKRNGRPQNEIDTVAADSDTQYEAGELGANGDTNGADKITVLTKFYKLFNDTGTEYTVHAVKVTNGATVREEWDTGLRLYPFSAFVWERRRNCAYGDSEITYLIPNQIAINRMITASVWAVMVMGMPIMVVNTDIVTTQDITNEPGQIVNVVGDNTAAAGAISYVNPPNFSPRFSENVDQMIAQTLTQSGANDAALGDIRPDNTSAIIAVREAATMPLQVAQNRFYTFIEDTARVWADFWLVNYGKRSIKVEDDTGTWYMPFDSDRYKDLIVSTKIDIGASNLWSEAQSIATLDNLFDRQVIDVIQYLQRLPRGTVPNVDGLIRSLREANAAAAQKPVPSGDATVSSLSPAPGGFTEQDVLNNLPSDVLQQLDAMPGNVKGKIVNAAMNANTSVPDNMPTGNML